MIKVIKIRIKLNNKEKAKLFESAEVARIKYKLFLNRLIGMQ